MQVHIVHFVIASLNKCLIYYGVGQLSLIKTEGNKMKYYLLTITQTVVSFVGFMTLQHHVTLTQTNYLLVVVLYYVLVTIFLVNSLWLFIEVCRGAK